MNSKPAAAPTIQAWLIEHGKNGQCGSPMEALFRGALLLHATETAHTLIQQAPVGKYFADFLFRLASQPSPGQPRELVVEIDGHDFHERTKEQAAHDKQRDRWVMDQGYGLMRFTGSEVWANPFACVDEVHRRLRRMLFGDTTKSAAEACIAQMRAMFESAA